ncbi:MAG: AAA family ATPase, partial [Saprospiraceae bacterium]|nr:AAA family ATPase [Saprospiraceae bacterium]
MKILKVFIKNINSLQGEFVIDFEQYPLNSSGLFVITGDTGAGKTSILDAITLALYGRVARNDKAFDVMSHNSVETMATTIFSIDNAKYQSSWSLKRSRGKVDGKIQDAEHKLAKWNYESEVYEIISEKKSETKILIEQITKLDFDRFCKSVMLVQGDFAAFLKAKDDVKSQLLERIAGTTFYSD